MFRIAALFLATFAATSVAQQSSPVTTPRPTPAPLQVPNPHYVTLLLTQDVNAPADTVWARVGKYCDIGEWAFPDCKLLAGDGGYASVRNIVNEVLVGETGHSYTYTQPVRVGQTYNLYHGTLEARPVTATTSKLVYTLIFDNSMLPDDAAREKDRAGRTARFKQALENMKILAEGGTLPPPPARGAPPAASPLPPPASASLLAVAEVGLVLSSVSAFASLAHSRMTARCSADSPTNSSPQTSLS